MIRTLPCSSRRRTDAIIAIFVYLMVIAVSVRGGENASDKTVFHTNEAYRQALRKAEQELPGREAILDGGNGWSLSAIFSIVALGLAVGMTAWLMHRFRRHGWAMASGKEMRILDSLPLGRQSTLFLVQVRGRHYWLAEHSGGVTLLGECPPPDKPMPSFASGNAEPPEKHCSRQHP